MMQIMILGDSHGNLSYVEQAIELAHIRNMDLIFQVGDFGIWDHVPAGKRFLDRVDKYLDERQIDLFFCDGNHENFDSLEDYPLLNDGFRQVRDRIFHAPRGHSWTWNNVRFMSFGGAHSIDGPGGPPWWNQARGPAEKDTTLLSSRGHRFYAKGQDMGSWWAQETIKPEEVDALEPTPIDVLFSHECPQGIKIPGINGYPAGNAQRDLLRKVVDKTEPQLVVHGHYHRFHQGPLDNGKTHVVGLASDMNDAGQYCFIGTTPFQLHVPKWEQA